MSEQSGKSERSDRPPRSGSSGADRQQGDSGTDLLGDLQRWLIRSSAKNMRRELEDQVRRTVGGQRRQDRADVWDVATTEIPPEVGEAPECQWCPICRAARRMRDSRRPGLAGQISGAGEAVATAVQDAISALDSLLTRPGGRDTGATGGTDLGETRADPASPPAGSAKTEPGEAAGPESASSAEPAETTAARPDSLAGEHGQVGWKPGDRLATAGPAGGDPWATVTDSDPDTADGTGSGSAEDRSDGRGHGPSDRG
jgi:hypothetical protein